jgi:2-polyprenyl-3-methyl-5-hydroxy-6-metoxy-1,4-benzoquinol methylase
MTIITQTPPESAVLEPVACYLCGGGTSTPFVSAEDDLTGKPGRFHFVRCLGCGLAYQNPRINLSHIRAYYDDEYIAHRKRRNWGPLAPLVRWAMGRLDVAKERIVKRHVLLSPTTRVLDVGCGAGTFLLRLRARHGVHATGVDFVDLAHLPGLQALDFRCGLFYDQDFGPDGFDLVTMWHFLEHDYDPARSLRAARDILRPAGRLVIEVPRLDSMTFRMYGRRWPGLQAPQHTALYTKAALLAMVEHAGLEVVQYLPYGAYPAYFYLFAGIAFVLRRGRGLDLSRVVVPYFIGQFALLPVLVFERTLNLAMQTVVCRRRT